MPKIYEYFGIMFFIYPNDHLPIHIHCKIGEYQTVFEVTVYKGKLVKITKRQHNRHPLLPKAKETQAIDVIKFKYMDIANKWVKITIQGKSEGIVPIKITKIKK